MNNLSIYRYFKNPFADEYTHHKKKLEIILKECYHTYLKASIFELHFLTPPTVIIHFANIKVEVTTKYHTICDTAITRF